MTFGPTDAQKAQWAAAEAEMRLVVREFVGSLGREGLLPRDLTPYLDEARALWATYTPGHFPDVKGFVHRVANETGGPLDVPQCLVCNGGEYQHVLAALFPEFVATWAHGDIYTDHVYTPRPTPTVYEDPYFGSGMHKGD